MRHLFLIPLLLVVAFAATPRCASAQLATLRGRVTASDDDTALRDVTVLLTGEDGDRRGTSTNAEGLFILTRIPPGTYVFSASYVGFATKTDTLALAFGQTIVYNLSLEPQEQQLGEVVVASEAGANERSGAGLISISARDVELAPMPDVSADLMGFLLSQRGVVTTGDRGGQIFVRGGTPTQNLVLIDGMPVYQPFHIVGFYSVFPADIISHADFYAGGFGAQYGGRISSVIDVTTLNGNKHHPAGAVSLAPFLGSVRLELPIVKDKVSVIGSVRESIIERISPDLLGERLPYRFGDRFFKLHAFLNETSSLFLTALRSFDEGDVSNLPSAPDLIAWRNETYGGRYSYLPENYPVLIELAVQYAIYDSRFGPEERPERTASIEGFNGEISFTYLFGESQYRMAIFGRSNEYAYSLDTGRQRFDEFVGEGGFYATADVPLSHSLRAKGGMRLHSFPSRDQVNLEPRLRMTWQPGGLGSRQQVSAAFGIYHQEIIGLNDQRDVSDTFIAWSPAPEGVPLPKAVHYLAGWKRRMAPWLDVSIEGYYRDLSNVTVTLFDETVGSPFDLIQADGSAEGLDLHADFVRGAFSGSATYSLAEVAYRLGKTRFNPAHDRRHQLSVIVRYERGPYALSAHWQYGSGLPFTQINGFYDVVPVDAPGSFHTDPGQIAVSFSDPYRARLPAYHRLDVSAERTFHAGPVDAILRAGVVNAYDRANIFDYDLLRSARVDQLPLIPFVGLKMEVR